VRRAMDSVTGKSPSLRSEEVAVERLEVDWLEVVSTADPLFCVNGRLSSLSSRTLCLRGSTSNLLIPAHRRGQRAS